ncbi:hypothetical protein ABW19_dt0207103 [Dactylella cylindrospora]|nr:hypothetical protein ABW19_dt0207103 [Dactylella cylindrospora]
MSDDSKDIIKDERPKTPEDPIALIPEFPDENISEYPEVKPGGSLLLAWQVRNKRVLMVGGGNVAASRILNLLNADALITLVCPPTGLHPETAHRIKTFPTRITYIPRPFHPTDLSDASLSLVLTAIDDPLESTRIYTLCKQLKIPVNVADVPPECDFYFGSIHRDGPLQIMVSTNGNGPRLAAMIRRKVAEALPENTGAAIVKVGELRRKLRKMVPGTGEGQKRMEWMSRVCEEWGFEELAGLTDGEMEVLLRGFGEGRVDGYEEVVRVAKLMEAVKLGEEEDDKEGR